MGVEVDGCNLSGYTHVYINGRTGGITILLGTSINTALIHFIKTLCLQWEYMSLKHNILRALGLYQTSTLKNFFKIVLGSHSAYGRTLHRDSGGIHLRPVCFDMARDIREPSMHADLFIALMRGTAPRNCCTKLK